MALSVPNYYFVLWILDMNLSVPNYYFTGSAVYFCLKYELFISIHAIISINSITSNFDCGANRC